MEPLLIIFYTAIGVFLGAFATGFGVHLCLRNKQLQCCCPRDAPLERVTFRNTSFLSNSSDASEESVFTVCPALSSPADSSTHSHAE